MVVEEKYYHHPLRNIKPANILSKWQTGREFLTVSSRSNFTLKTCIFKFRNRIAEEIPYWKSTHNSGQKDRM